MSQIYSPSSTPVYETRPFSVASQKAVRIYPGGVGGGQSVNILSATGPGNVARIQLAAGWGYVTPVDVAQRLLITIVVDGQTYTAPLGMFMLWDGWSTLNNSTGPSTALQASSSQFFLSKYLGIAIGGDAQMGGYRRINIPYQSSISITVSNPSDNATSAFVYSQVEYYPGVAPAGLYPPTQKVFHMVTNDWRTSSIVPDQVVTFLPTVSGVGELESLYFVSSAAGSLFGAENWLELAPIISFDGNLFSYRGCEDFFGTQFYGMFGITRGDEYGQGISFAGQNLGTTDAVTYWTGYRYFKNCPLRFNSSLGINWTNLDTAFGNPATQVGSCVVYYTES
jgi:hypothetical protein